MKYPPTNRRSGFTLSEILISMLVFSIAITTILALLARSIETVDEIVMKDEAMRLTSAVETLMDGLTFDQVYSKFGKNNNARVIAYFYRGDPTGTLRTRPNVTAQNNYGEEASPPPYTGLDGRVGEDFILVAKARVPGDPYLQADMPAKASNAFWVDLSISSANPVAESALPASADAYPSAVLVFDAVFRPDNRNVSLSGVNFGSSLNASPVFQYTFAVRR